MEQAKKNKAKQREKKQAFKSVKREMCHCQAMVHQLVSNWTGWGRIIWEQEGEGEWLHCGEFVESINSVLDDEIDEEKKKNPALEQALEKRNKLLEYDALGGHSIIKDQQSDWYELENDTWQSREQREFAKKIREFEEKRIVEEEDAVYLNIGGEGKDFVGVEKGKATKTQEMINQEANEYINQLAADQIKDNIDQDIMEDIKGGFKNVTIKSCDYLDEKSKELYNKLKEDTYKQQEELYLKNSKKDVYVDIKKQGFDFR